MFRSVLLALGFALATACRVLAAGTPAGTTIVLSAEGAYSTQSGAVDVVYAQKTLYVGQKVAAEMGTSVTYAESSPGRAAYIPFKLRNIGNGDDLFLFASVECSTGWPCEVIWDENQDGVHSSSEETVMWITDWVKPDESISCFVRVQVPASCEGTASVHIWALSLLDTSVEFFLDVPLVVSDSPVINITRPTDEPEFARNSPVLYLSGTCSDATGVSSIECINSTTGQVVYCEVDGSKWSSPQIDLDLGLNNLYLIASDAHGNCGVATATVSYVQAFPGDAWKGASYVSLPIIPDATDPKQVTGFDGNNWNCWNPWIRAYDAYPAPTTFLNPPSAVPGRGFRAVFKGVLPDPVGTIPRQDVAVSVKLAPGWNLIGQPFISSIEWNIDRIQVGLANGSVLSLREAPGIVDWTVLGWEQNPDDPYTGRFYPIRDASVSPGGVSSLAPWRSYWVQAFQECDLIFPGQSL